MSRKKNSVNTHTTEPQFPYTTSPASLRKFLAQVPTRPKPGRFNPELYKSWGIKDTNANTITRVLKALDLVSGSNEVTPRYEAFMHKTTGPAVLGEKLRAVYSPLFQASHTPYSEADATLQNLFNIHSGGGEKTLKFQIQTFKALCEFASFDTASLGVVNPPVSPGMPPSPATSTLLPGGSYAPTLHIDLHIHLPENKTARDYEAIFQDIARYIYQRETINNDQ